MAPKVLVSDKLSETAVQIFRDRGVEVDYLPDIGKDKDKLAEMNLALKDSPPGFEGASAYDDTSYDDEGDAAFVEDEQY